MTSSCARFAMLTLLLAAMAIRSPTSLAADAHEHQLVEGISIYLGILPAEIFAGLPKARPESEMHGGPPASEHAYHLVVALFDQATGVRIRDARVSAAVSEINYPGHQRKLEPMRVAGTVAYGNYFDLLGTGPYRIVLHILRPGNSRLIEAEFVFKHART